MFEIVFINTESYLSVMFFTDLPLFEFHMINPVKSSVGQKGRIEDSLSMPDCFSTIPEMLTFPLLCKSF
jgi:hypothetical protein